MSSLIWTQNRYWEWQAGLELITGTPFRIGNYLKSFLFNNLTPGSTGIVHKNSFTNNDYNCFLCFTFRWLSKRNMNHVDFWSREQAVDLDVSNVNTEISKSHSMGCAGNLWLRGPIFTTKYAEILIMCISLNSGIKNVNWKNKMKTTFSNYHSIHFISNLKFFFMYRKKHLTGGLLTTLSVAAKIFI